MENIPSNLKWAKSLFLGGLIIGSIIISFFGVLLIGSYIGNMLNPTTTYHECVCDDPPVLSVQQAFIVGIVYICTLMKVLYHVLNSFGLTNGKRKILLLVLFILNGTFSMIALDILSTEVSG